MMARSGENKKTTRVALLVDDDDDDSSGATRIMKGRMHVSLHYLHEDVFKIPDSLTSPAPSRSPLMQTTRRPPHLPCPCSALFALLAVMILLVSQQLCLCISNRFQRSVVGIHHGV